MKNNLLFYLFLLFFAVQGCKKDSTTTEEETPADNSGTTDNTTLLYPGTLTVTLNGDGYTNATFVYKGQAGNPAQMWAVWYSEPTSTSGGFSFSQLYYNPPQYSATVYDSAAGHNGMVTLHFSGKAPITENWSETDITDFRGISSISFRKPGESSVRTYWWEDGSTTGTTTVTEYGTKVKGTFSGKKLLKLDVLSTDKTYVDISGSFDLEPYKYKN
jgi:hypothetical protein